MVVVQSPNFNTVLVIFNFRALLALDCPQAAFMWLPSVASIVAQIRLIAAEMSICPPQLTRFTLARVIYAKPHGACRSWTTLSANMLSFCTSPPIWYCTFVFSSLLRLLRQASRAHSTSDAAENLPLLWFYVKAWWGVRESAPAPASVRDFITKCLQIGNAWSLTVSRTRRP